MTDSGFFSSDGGVGETTCRDSCANGDPFVTRKQLKSKKGGPVPGTPGAKEWHLGGTRTFLHGLLPGHGGAIYGRR